MDKDRKKRKYVPEEESEFGEEKLKEQKVCIVGLGTVGLPTALHVSKFFDVVGYDISTKTVERASSHGILAKGSSLPRADVYVLTVNTGYSNGEPDMQAIHNTCKKIAGLASDVLICIESTVSIGTCRKLAETFDLNRVVHCPHRYYHEEPFNHGVVQHRVLGAINEESLKAGKRFYDLLEIPVHVTSSIEYAELCKIAENAYRFIQISFAEELSLICRRLGLSFEEVRNACNTKWNIEILEARDGIGGDCLPKDIRYLLSIMKSPLCNGAVQADEIYKIKVTEKERENDNDNHVNSSIQ